MDNLTEQKIEQAKEAFASLLWHLGHVKSALLNESDCRVFFPYDEGIEIKDVCAHLGEWSFKDRESVSANHLIGFVGVSEATLVKVGLLNCAKQRFCESMPINSELYKGSPLSTYIVEHALSRPRLNLLAVYRKVPLLPSTRTLDNEIYKLESARLSRYQQFAKITKIDLKQQYDSINLIFKEHGLHYDSFLQHANHAVYNQVAIVGKQTQSFTVNMTHKVQPKRSLHKMIKVSLPSFFHNKSDVRLDIAKKQKDGRQNRADQKIDYSHVLYKNKRFSVYRYI